VARKYLVSLERMADIIYIIFYNDLLFIYNNNGFAAKEISHIPSMFHVPSMFHAQKNVVEYPQSPSQAHSGPMFHIFHRFAHPCTCLI
jgi:hypothetical protein